MEQAQLHWRRNYKANFCDVTMIHGGVTTAHLRAPILFVVILSAFGKYRVSNMNYLQKRNYIEQ